MVFHREAQRGGGHRAWAWSDLASPAQWAALGRPPCGRPPALHVRLLWLLPVGIRTLSGLSPAAPVSGGPFPPRGRPRSAAHPPAGHSGGFLSGRFRLQGPWGPLPMGLVSPWSSRHEASLAWPGWMYPHAPALSFPGGPSVERPPAHSCVLPAVGTAWQWPAWALRPDDRDQTDSGWVCPLRPRAHLRLHVSREQRLAHVWPA